MQTYTLCAVYILYGTRDQFLRFVDANRSLFSNVRLGDDLYKNKKF